ncbi:ArsR/SmtB family transcription factor [Candidatus Pyrohabitans sp.]
MDREIRMTRQVFEALVSETRIAILRALDRRAMTVTELARELGLAKSAAHEHLAKLADAGLVEKRDEGRKWIYYHLTPKARGILHPEERHRILILLSSALLALLGGAFSGFRYLHTAGGFAEREMLEAAPKAMATPAAQEALRTSTNYLLVSVVLLAASALLFFFAYRTWKRSRNPYNLPGES